MVKRIFFISILLIVSLCNVLIAQQITASASVDSADYSVGDYIHYTIKINSAKGLRVFKPELKDSLKAIDIVKAAEIKSDEIDNKTITEIKYILAKYDSGDVRIPQIPVFYSVGSDTARKTVFTNDVSFTVHTLKVNSQADIKDVKQPIKIPLDWKTILLWAFIIILVIGLIVWGVLYYRKKQAAKKGIIKVIEKKPYEAALESLKELEAKQLWQKGQIKTYHSELTDIIRRYFENRFYIRALEMTTSELIQQLNQVKDAREILDTTSAFLNNADMVKFAKYIPMDRVNEEMMEQAYSIVNVTIPRFEMEEGNGRAGNVQ